MNWLNHLENKFGKYAIRNLPLYIVILYGVGTLLNISSQGQLYYTVLSLNPYLVLHGQPWRIFTFLIATSETNLIFLIFMLLFYYSLGESLVQVWGAFRFNMYILVGILGTIAAAFIVYAIYPSPNIFMDTYYLNLSIFLAYAAIFPEMKVYLYGLIPVKVKWMAFLDLALLAYDFFAGGIGARISIIVSLLNFIVFFFSSRDYNRIRPSQVKRRAKFRKEAGPAPGVGGAAYRHKCHICGRTELDDPTLEFRYCSKCNGSYEYCNDHLFTHIHVK